MSLDSTLLSAPYPDLVAFEAFGRNHRYLESIWPELVRDFEHEFVAAHKCRVVAHSPDLDAIERELDRRGIPPLERALVYVRSSACEDLLQLIAGEFDQGGQPRLEAEVILPAFGFTRHVSFVVDTGAARTTLTARDFAPVRAEVIRFQPEILASGFGGPVMGVRELGLITLHEPAAGWHRFQLTVNLSPSGTALPSVLGRDVLSRCTMWWDPVGRRLEFNVLESDAFAPEA